MTTFWIFLLLGIGLAPAYILAAQGTVLVYRGSRVVNFTQGGFALIGALTSYELQLSGASPWLALIGGVAASAAAGALAFGVVMRRLKKASQLMRVVATLGLSVIITQAVGLRLSDDSYFPQRVISNRTLHFLSATITVYDLTLFLFSLVLTAVLAVIYRHTKFGIKTTAVAENTRAAEALAHSPDVIGLINWTAGGALGGLAGILISPDIGLSLDSIAFLLIPALAAALLGRFESFTVTCVGGLIVGIGSSELTRYNLGTGWSDAFPFLLVIAVLLFRSRTLPPRGELAARLPAIGTGRVRWPIVIAAAVALGIVTLVLSSNGQAAMSVSLQAAIIGLSIIVVTGYAGQVSLAQFGLAGGAGFLAAKLCASFGFNFWEALVVAVAAAIPVGIIVGLPSLRTRGVNLAIVTLGLGLTIQDVLLNNPNYAGPGGEIPTNPPSLFGYSLNPTFYPGRYALLCLVLFVIAAVMVANLRRGRVGKQLIALRSNERAASALGIDVAKAKLYAFAAGAAIAALGGVLMSFESPIVVFLQGSGGPAFDPLTSITFLSLMIVGGIGFIGGSLFAGQIVASGVGAWILLVITNSPLASDWLALAGGVGSVLVVIFNPDGLAAKQAKDFARWFHRPLEFLDRFSRKRQVTFTPVEASPRSECVLEIGDLSVRFGGVVALDNVSLSLKSGEILGLIGPNGAGKTTLIDAVSGHNRRYQGRIALNGERLDGKDATARARLGIGRSFQSLELFDDLTVADNLAVGADRARWFHYGTDLFAPGAESLPATAAYAVGEFQLTGDLDRKPMELPFGRRRLLGIARAVAANPAALLLDEPAAGLDERESAELATVLKRLAHERGFAILLVEHDMSLVMAVSDRIVALDFGSKIAEGTPDEVRTNPMVITAYLGLSEDEVAGSVSPAGETVTEVPETIPS